MMISIKGQKEQQPFRRKSDPEKPKGINIEINETPTKETMKPLSKSLGNNNTFLSDKTFITKTSPIVRNAKGKKSKIEEQLFYLRLQQHLEKLPLEILLDILSFLPLNFPDDFLSKQDDIHNKQSLEVNSGKNNQVDQIHLQLEKISQLGNFYGKFKSNPNRIFFLFSSICFTMNTHLSTKKLFYTNATGTAEEEKFISTEQTKKDKLLEGIKGRQFTAVKSKKKKSYNPTAAMNSYRTTASIMYDDNNDSISDKSPVFVEQQQNEDDSTRMVKFVMILSTFHQVCHQYPFKNIRIIYSEPTKQIFQFWKKQMYSNNNNDNTYLFNSKSKIELIFNNEEMKMEEMDEILEDLLYDYYNSEIMNNNNEKHDNLLQHLTKLQFLKCNRFRTNLKIDRKELQQMILENDFNILMLEERTLRFIDILNAIPNLEKIKISHLIDEQDDTLHYKEKLYNKKKEEYLENEKEKLMGSRELARLNQFFKRYAFKGNVDSYVSASSRLREEEEEERQRQQLRLEEEREEKRKKMIEKLTLKQTTKLKSCFVNGLKEHEVEQLFQNALRLKVLSLNHFTFNEYMAERFLFSSIEVLHLTDCIIEDFISLEYLLSYHTHLKILHLKNITYGKLPEQYQDVFGYIMSTKKSDLSNSMWSEKEGKLFANNRTLIELNIAHCPNLFDTKFIEQLSYNRSLTRLLLTDCKLLDDKIRPILRNNKNIEYLDLSNNKGGNITKAMLIAYHCYRDYERMKIKV
ncbi:hypothetical protein ABK040_012635 [Willaertia magna]